MKKTKIKLICTALALCATVNLTLSLTGCSGVRAESGAYTFRTYTTALGTNWNPHTWEANADSLLLEYLSTPLVSISIKSSEFGIYTWVYEMAESVEDVTAYCQSDLKKYNVTTSDGQSADSITQGYVFEIKLNRDAKWENSEPITADDYIYSMQQLLDPKMKNYRSNLYRSEESAIAGADDYYNGKTQDFSDVGLYKTDEYALRYVTQNRIELSYFLSSLTSNWLVYRDMYEKGKSVSGELTVTNYNTSAKTTVSYGPYRLSSIQDAKQAVLVQNESWYGYKNENGHLVSYTNFDVDGKAVPQYTTTKIIIDVMDSRSAKSAFLRGELSEWHPSADDIQSYISSDRLYKNNETYTMSLFFNTNKDALSRLDRQGNKCSVVLSNRSFRKAISRALDRSRLTLATQGYTPEFTLLGSLYHYDIYNDPSSVYRSSPQAMRAICELYGVNYGDGQKTLTEAYSSITGYSQSEAKALMKQACDELVSEGLYRRGDPIIIRVGWSKGSLSSDDSKLISLINKSLNDAAENSGFGEIRIEAVGNIENRYSAVPAGEYAIGYGAWGGAAFYPFRSLQVYMDPDKYGINEAGCYDPRTETLTLDVNGKHVTKSWQAWSSSLTGSGEYANADIDTRLTLLSQLEAAFLDTYFRIPLFSTTQSVLLSYQCEYATDRYNIMYGFGGIRLMSYNYDDAQWQEYVRKNKFDLSYE